jgi:hypothetical protein
MAKKKKVLIREEVHALLGFCAFSAGLRQNRAEFNLER